ncbi:MAG: uL30 family ribosomal protein [archaeon]|nr:uL30 family ribosomal protein [Nanoarchaeota archaeon]
MLAAVLVRGMNKVRTSVKDTLKMLNLNHTNQCVILNNSSINIGMLKKVKDYLTWGEIDDATLNELVEKCGEEFKAREADSKGKIKYNKYFEHNGKKVNKTFRLNPPRKGFGRKGVKVPFTMSGGLGYRGEKINDLLKRMI